MIDRISGDSHSTSDDLAAFEPENHPEETGNQPVQLRSQEKKEAILRAALRIFAENGFDGSRTRDIAAEAGVHHPAIKYYFGNKEGLWRETVRWMFACMEQEVVVPLDQSGELSDIDRFERFLELYIRYCAQHPEHARITIAETNRGGERLEWIIENFVMSAHQTAFELYDRLIAQGYLPDLPKISLLYSIVGVCQLPFVISKEAKMAFGVDMRSEEMIEQQVRTVRQLLLAKPHVRNKDQTVV